MFEFENVCIAFVMIVKIGVTRKLLSSWGIVRSNKWYVSADYSSRQETQIAESASNQILKMLNIRTSQVVSWEFKKINSQEILVVEDRVVKICIVPNQTYKSQLNHRGIIKHISFQAVLEPL